MNYNIHINRNWIKHHERSRKQVFDFFDKVKEVAQLELAMNNPSLTEELEEKLAAANEELCDLSF